MFFEEEGGEKKDLQSVRYRDANKQPGTSNSLNFL